MSDVWFGLVWFAEMGPLQDQHMRECTISTVVCMCNTLSLCAMPDP